MRPTCRTRLAVLQTWKTGGFMCPRSQFRVATVFSLALQAVAHRALEHTNPTTYPTF